MLLGIQIRYKSKPIVYENEVDVIGGSGISNGGLCSDGEWCLCLGSFISYC